MILNHEKIFKCDPRVEALVKFVEGLYANVVITSGYRSEADNAAVGGVKNSYHTQGLAVDLYVPDVHILKLAGALVNANQKLGFHGLGVNVYKQPFLHIDFRAGNSIVTWVYNKFGKEA